MNRKKATVVRKVECVEELGGIYGPFAISEKIVQGLWRRQWWNTGNLRTWDGKPMRVEYPGKWNHLEGPDFKGALVEVDGQRMLGDIEIHFYPEDWNLHGHVLDTHYNGVCLHVSVFPPRIEELELRKADGTGMPLLVLAPYLPADLETLLMEEAACDADEAGPGWRDLPHEQSAESLLWQRARNRFAAKVRFADWQLSRFGWHQACHEALLASLGMPRNRPVMLSAASVYSWDQLSSGIRWEPQEILKQFSAKWKKQGIRPANQPLRRLTQYGELLMRVPDWPEALRKNLPGPRTTSVGSESRDLAWLRRDMRLSEWNQLWRDGLFCSIWKGSRWHTLVVDVLLPLLAADNSREDLESAWMAWWSGDWPDTFHHSLRDACWASPKPLLGANAWSQGLLEWRLEKEVEGAVRHNADDKAGPQAV